MKKNRFVKYTLPIFFFFYLFILSAHAKIFTKVYYVKVDHIDKTAYMFDNNFKKLVDSAYVPNTSMEIFPSGKPYWYLGLKSDVIRKNGDGSIDVVTHDPRYYEMNHHFVMAYGSEKKPATDECGFSRPIAVGSEMTSFSFPAGYAYKMDGGVLTGGSWHWSNPAKVPTSEDIYLRFIATFDDSPKGYKDVNVSWIDMVPCSSTFAVKSGESEYTGPKQVAKEDMRIVMVLPHIHDHAKKFELLHNGKKLRKFKIGYQSVPVEHNVASGGLTPIHTDKDHLPADGMPVWKPGVFGKIIKKGDYLSVKGEFKNPHPRSIDNMLIALIFWEPVKK